MDMGGEEEEEVMLKPKFLAYKEGNVYTKVRNTQRGQSGREEGEFRLPSCDRNPSVGWSFHQNVRLCFFLEPGVAKYIGFLWLL